MVCEELFCAIGRSAKGFGRARDTAGRQSSEFGTKSVNVLINPFFSFSISVVHVRRNRTLSR